MRDVKSWKLSPSLMMRGYTRAAARGGLVAETVSVMPGKADGWG